ncbi:hypothetical protein GCM10009646_79130 [Streptomyces aureus]
MSNRARVHIDRSDAIDRFRFVCPAGHTTWERCNSHAWCAQCSKASQQGSDVEPEFYEIWDKKTGDMIAYDAIEFEGPDEESQRRVES